MDRNLRLRTFALVVIVVSCVLYLLPTFVDSNQLPSWFFDKKITLGTDLQGGAYFVYDIDLNKAVDDKASGIKGDLEAKLLDKSIENRVTLPNLAPGAISVVLADPAKRPEVEKLISSDYGDVVTGRSCSAKETEDQAICVRVSSKFADSVRKSALASAVRTIKSRIDARGVAEPTVIEKDDQIIVELPGLDKENINRVKELIARTAKLEFKIVDDGQPWMAALYQRVTGGHGGETVDPVAKELGITGYADSWTHDKKPDAPFRDWYLIAHDREESITVAEAKEQGCWRRDMTERDGKVRCKVTGRRLIERYLDRLAKLDKDPVAVPETHQIGFELVYPDPDSDRADKRPYWRTYFLDRNVYLTGSQVSNAAPTYDPNTLRPEVRVEFNRQGGRAFGDLTAKNVGRKMAIILDDKVASAPIIQTAIRQGVSTITMGGTDPRTQEREANDLVNVLKTGSLPAPLIEKSTAELGPTLGRDAVSKAQFSFGLGTVLVILIMVGVYRWSGAISIVALAINITMMMAAMAMFGATLTLPGIAALVLTVGMAVDGNILIYERIRDELNTGKSVKGAVEVGFQRAFSSIFDGQLTTAAAGWVLLQYGSGPIKGFATMLLVGIATTLFTNTWVTRLFFDLYIHKKKGELATISI